MLIMTGKKRNYTYVSIQAGNIDCERRGIKVSDDRHVELSLPYNEIIVAYIETFDNEKGNFYRPEIMELTDEMTGSLVLYDSNFVRFEIHLEKTEKTAGTILKQIAVHAPYIFLSYQPWLDERDEEHFAEVKEMVSIMRDIPGGSAQWSPCSLP